MDGAIGAQAQRSTQAGGKGLAQSEGALAGIKVIDLSRVLGGPYATMILSDHGAEVIKVEPPQGDETRDWGPPFLDGDASYFIGVNRNKRSIALDIGKPEGKRRAAPPARGGGRAGRELQDRLDGALGPRLCGRTGKALPAPDPLPRLGVRRGRAARRPAGLRRDPAGDDRADERQRRSRRPARSASAPPSSISRPGSIRCAAS